MEQYLEDALAESLLKGEFDGKETITVVVTKDEDGEDKLSFELSVATPPAALPAAEPVPAAV